MALLLCCCSALLLLLQSSRTAVKRPLGSQQQNSSQVSTWYIYMQVWKKYSQLQNTGTAVYLIDGTRAHLVHALCGKLAPIPGNEKTTTS